MDFLVLRIKYALENYPLRWSRLISHFLLIPNQFRAAKEKWYDWPIDLIFFLMDIFLFPDLADLIYNGLKTKRKLNLKELESAKALFGESLNYDQVFVIETRQAPRKNMFFAFVSFNTINCIKEIPLAILIHEMVHIWQYQKYGSLYIFRALRAQASKEAYDYGELEGLGNARDLQKDLWSFNFEQQAQIVEDYYRMNTALEIEEKSTKLYLHYVKQLVENDDIFMA